MTIDKEQLISLLEEKTGLEREQVEGQLSQLIDRIKKAAEEGKDFEIEGFGTFSMTDGLEFTPVDKLETEINNKYAGMKPIELIGAFKEPESEEEVPDVHLGEAAEEDEKWAFDTDAVNEHEGDEETVAPEASETEEIEAQQEEEILQTSQKENTFEDEEDDIASIATASTEEADAEKTEEFAPTEKEHKKEVASNSLDTFLVAAVIVLAVGLGGWMVYEMGFSEDNGSITENSELPAETTTPQMESTSQQSTPGVNDGQESNSEPEQLSAVTKEQGSNEELSNQQQNTYGLRGDSIQDISSGYTIVVHSLQNEQKAQQNRKRLQAAGFRALISRAEVQGQMYYRVGLGQFKTVEEAQKATVNIPEQYKNSNFIKRIQ